VEYGTEYLRNVTENARFVHDWPFKADCLVECSICEIHLVVAGGVVRISQPQMGLSEFLVERHWKEAFEAGVSRTTQKALRRQI